MRTSLLFLLLFLTLASADASENWGQWRGPFNSGASTHADPPVTWSETENIKWKVPIEGRGTSTPIVWEERIFLLTAVKTMQKDSSIPDPENQPKTNFFDIKRPNTLYKFVVICLDRRTGEELWRDVAAEKIPHEGVHNDNNFASASPTTDGRHLICWFGSAGLFCYDLMGRKLWDRNLGEADVGSSLGEGSSPVLYEDKLIIVRDFSHKGAIEVFDAASGTTIWRRSRNEANAWATPVVAKHSGRTQVITCASGHVRSYDLDSGEVIWQCSGLTGNCTPCPQICDGHVICMSGYQGYAAMAIPLSETGDISGSEKVRWSLDKGTPYVPSAVLHDGRLYFNQSNQAIIRCIDATSGKTIFGPNRIGGLSNIYASPVAARNRIYILGRGGSTAVLRHGVEYELLAVNRLNERFDASPALADNQLFLRGERHLYCIEED